MAHLCQVYCVGVREALRWRKLVEIPQVHSIFPGIKDRSRLNAVPLVIPPLRTPEDCNLPFLELHQLVWHEQGTFNHGFREIFIKRQLSPRALYIDNRFIPKHVGELIGGLLRACLKEEMIPAVAFDRFCPLLPVQLLELLIVLQIQVKGDVLSKPHCCHLIHQVYLRHISRLVKDNLDLAVALPLVVITDLAECEIHLPDEQGRQPVQVGIITGGCQEDSHRLLPEPDFLKIQRAFRSHLTYIP